MSIREEVLNEALSLSAEDRAYLAERLDESLPHGYFATPEIGAAWSAEIDRRIAAYERGEVQASDAATTLSRLRNYLSEHRARRTNQ